MTLDNKRIKKWSDIADTFLKQYKFNNDITSEQTSFIMMEKSNKETIREPTHWWKNKAMHVPLLEKKMVTLFINIFKAPYYKHLMGSSAQHFNDVIVIAKRIKQEIKTGRIS